MKNSIQAKKQHGNRAAAAKTVAPLPTRSALKRWAVPVLCLIAAFGGTWALLELVVWNVIPSELVGKWVVVSPEAQKGATLDFYRNGKMRGRMNAGGKLRMVYANIRVEGRTIYSTTAHPETGAEKTMIQHIRTLTANRLVVEDDQGQPMSMERAD